AVNADASLTQVGERQVSNAEADCASVARSALSLAHQALNGTPQSEVTPHASCFFVRAAGSIEL
ncbi:jg1560, partial [Pararge aegeria aegeria]